MGSVTFLCSFRLVNASELFDASIYLIELDLGGHLAPVTLNFRRGHQAYPRNGLVVQVFIVSIFIYLNKVSVFSGAFVRGHKGFSPLHRPLFSA